MKNINLENVPDELYQQITEIATEENCSLNQQLLLLLEKEIRSHKRPQPDIIEQIDRRREKITARVGIMPDSTELLRADRER
jgi:hypothetical protein